MKIPPPYYAVIFTARRTAVEGNYAETARRMEDLASMQSGYLGMEHARNADGFGITISYWETLDAIAAWKSDTEHQIAQQTGKAVWYSEYTVRICRVEREYGFYPDTP